MGGLSRSAFDPAGDNTFRKLNQLGFTWQPVASGLRPNAAGGVCLPSV